MYFFLKVVITALVVAGVSELARRYSLLAPDGSRERSRYGWRPR